MSNLSISDYQDMFLKMGITDPEQQQAILDFIDQMADIVMYILITQYHYEQSNSL